MAPENNKAVGESDFTSGFTQQGFEEAVERSNEYIQAGDIMQVVLSQRLSMPFPPRRSTCIAHCARSIRRRTCISWTWTTSISSVPRRKFWCASKTGGSPCARSPAPARAARRRRRRPGAGKGTAGRSQGTRRAIDADRPRPQRRRARGQDRQRPGDRQDGDRALLARDAHRLQCDGRPATGHGRHRRAARHLPGRHGERRAQDARHGNHRRTGTGRARHLFGAVGYIGWNGNMDTAIAIRTAVFKDKLYIQAGAGIVADSVPRSEWNETMNKARAVFRAVGIAAAGTGLGGGVMRHKTADDRQLRFLHLQPRAVLRRAGRGRAGVPQRPDHGSIKSLKPDHIVISPGPCTPNEAGVSVENNPALGRQYPILGVCLGHQSIGQAYGGNIVRAKQHHARQDFHDPAREQGCDLTGLEREIIDLIVSPMHEVP